jgi:hypothetical protein
MAEFKLESHEDNTFTLHLCTGEAQALFDILRKVGGTGKRRNIVTKIYDALYTKGVDFGILAIKTGDEGIHGTITFGTKKEHEALTWWNAAQNSQVKEYYKESYKHPSTKESYEFKYGVSAPTYKTYDAKNQKWTYTPIPLSAQYQEDSAKIDKWIDDLNK